MSTVEQERQLHTLIDRRMDLRRADLELVRGTVKSVSADPPQLIAWLDGAPTPTPNIAYPVHLSPVPGDDIVVARRSDGYLLAVAILGVAPVTSGTAFPADATLDREFYRSDLFGGSRWFYDGTRWVTRQSFSWSASSESQSAAAIVGAATGNTAWRMPIRAGYGVKMSGVDVLQLVATTHSAGNYWTVVVRGRLPSSFDDLLTWNTWTYDGGAGADAWSPTYTLDVPATTPDEYLGIYVYVSGKTGSPGNWSLHITFNFQLTLEEVATSSPSAPALPPTRKS